MAVWGAESGHGTRAAAEQDKAWAASAKVDRLARIKAARERESGRKQEA